MLLYLYQTLLLCLLLLPLHLFLYRIVSVACLHHSVVVVAFYWLRHYRHSYYDVLIDVTVRSRIVIIVLVEI